MSVIRRHPPDPMGCILAVAYQPGTAPPREIRLRPEVATRIGRHWLDYAERSHSLGDVTITIDRTIPSFPGFEIYRVPPASIPSQEARQ